MFSRCLKSFCMIALAIGLLGQSISAFGQTNIVVLEHPSQGALKFMPDGTGIVYLGNGELDRFSFATIDDEGFAVTEIDIDCSYGHDMVTLDFGGPLPLFPLTWRLTPEQFVSLQTNGEEDEGYVVIIRVDQPGAGGDQRPYRGGPIKGIAVGHTFVEVIDGSTGQSTTAGFYPTTGTSPWDPQSPGTIVNDAGHDWDVMLEIPITREQYNILIAGIENDRQNPPTYDLNDHNCTDWALNLLATIDIEINATKGTWRGGGGHNPGDLGEDLILIGGIRNPNQGTGGSGGGSSGGGGGSSGGGN